MNIYALSCLHYAACFGRPGIGKVLLRHGANPDLRLVIIFLRHGANPDLRLVYYLSQTRSQPWSQVSYNLSPTRSQPWSQVSHYLSPTRRPTLISGVIISLRHGANLDLKLVIVFLRRGVIISHLRSHILSPTRSQPLILGLSWSFSYKEPFMFSG